MSRHSHGGRQCIHLSLEPQSRAEQAWIAVILFSKSYASKIYYKNSCTAQEVAYDCLLNAAPVLVITRSELGFEQDPILL